MKRILIAIIVLLIFASICAAQPKVACVYSKYNNYACKSDQSQILASLGWTEETYENIHIKDLVQKLPGYDMVILNCLYNYENTQDLSSFGSDFRDYIAKGGCLLVTDANYTQHTGWLTSIDPGLVWNPSYKLMDTENQEVPWANTEHPLTANVSKPSSAWTYPNMTSPYMSVIYRNANGSPAISVMEIGKGVIVISSPYRFVDGFLKNLIKWIKDTDRANRVVERENKAQQHLSKLSALDIPVLVKAPVIDGKVDTGEWDGAAVISEFYDMYGRNDVIQPTICKIARTKDDFLVQFECFDNDMNKLAKGITARDGQTWDNDSIEIFLDPAGKRKTYYQFAVGCSGALYDGIGWDGTWDTYWEAKTSIGDKSWTVEMRIPLVSFGKEAISSGGTWTANFNRCARPTYSKELTGWSPTASIFHQPQKFGTLTGMAIKNDDLSSTSQIQVKTPSCWYMGKNEIDVTLMKEPKGLPDAVLQLLDLSKNTVMDSIEITANTKSTTRIKININLDAVELQPMQLVLRNKNYRNQILASSRVIKPEVAPILTANVVLPIVRGTIQSKDPIKKLVIDCLIGYNSPDRLQLECVGINASGIPVSTTHRSVRSRESLRISANVRQLPVGKYQFTLRLLDKGQEVYAEKIPLTIAPPATTEVCFDDKHVCYVNGKPFFPIGLYHVSQIVMDIINEKSRANGVQEVDLNTAIKELKERGFNAITYAWGMPDQKYLDYTQSLGMWVIPEAGVPTAENVALANRYNNVLMWYGQDEPSGEALERIKRERANTAMVDPNRPVSAAVCNNNLFKQALGGFDFVMMDPYLIRYSALSGIATWIKRGFDASNGQKPVWMVPQAFTIDSPLWKEPTPEELKAQAYISLVNGATGFIWYAFWSPEPWSGSPAGRGCWVLSDTKLWDAFPKLNAEVTELAPIILTGKKIGPAKCSSPDIHTCLWKYKGKTYLLAVNTLYTPVNCSIKGLGKEAEVLFENKKAVTPDGILKANFKPLEVHVYKFY